jgi:aminopeptidase 2
MCSGIHLRLIARSKAIRPPRSTHKVTSRPVLSPFPAFASSRSFSSVLNHNRPSAPISAPIPAPHILKNSKPTNFARKRNIKNLTSIRHCSHQRNMCKLSETAEVVGGGMDVSKGRELLPANVKPLHYHLTLEPNFEKFTYEGEVVIEYSPQEQKA